MLLIFNYSAQTVSDYTSFYNDIVPKLDTIAVNKTQFYGQNFSNFYNELLNKNITVVGLNYDTKADPDLKYYVLRLYFSDIEMNIIALNNSFQYPWISITFENEIPTQIKNMVLQGQGQWNSTFLQFFANMKIEKILFVGTNGHNSTNWTGK